MLWDIWNFVCVLLKSVVCVAEFSQSLANGKGDLKTLLAERVEWGVEWVTWDGFGNILVGWTKVGIKPCAACGSCLLTHGMEHVTCSSNF